MDGTKSFTLRVANVDDLNMTEFEGSLHLPEAAAPLNTGLGKVRRGFFSRPSGREVMLTVYRTLLFAGLVLLGFELLAVDASLLGLQYTSLNMRGVAALGVPRYRTDLDADQGFQAVGALATVGCFLLCLPSPFLRRHHRWLRWLLYLLFFLVLSEPQF